MKYLKLIRYQNLLLIALMQLVVLYGFLKIQNIWLFLEDWQYYLLILSTISIAAGGYIINDIVDQKPDAENKPNGNIVGKSISEGTAYNLYIGFTLIGVGTGFYLSNAIQKPGFVTVFILCAALLYMYATSFKQILLVKNLVVSFLLAFSMIIIGLFDIYPATTPENQSVMKVVFSILIDFSIIAFIINFIRELIKDMEDVKGDYNNGIQTLPILLGISRTAKVVFGLAIIPAALILYYTYNNLFHLQFATVYILAFLIGPLFYLMIKIWSARNKKEFSHLSMVLKLIILFGIIAIGVIGINMKYYAS
ncbi:geranylgeranylglycerol-phosphate geranylgeranyltransferase [Flavobacterium amniphilum]|uniref:geranylgeranylglycerol-phosphate geranylgeranyltransferase n=1 Tax=Flavobacterium amniphilum TaxID=1834035 RepID=UPI00202A9655|nr:geranylgeranylglycerol-phosphate geranylgeranyltransferase [Flavobacterium amniphilum]MCL9805729.1 geranylgeranylglycerol-phosphate geranylgeranyltransferase [Flavobacterium amniphilum]MCL9806316.1 geranylgeranylglycerol-phosphate geranylgeranyltransferase [Flavobacterium amniphilum]